MISYFIIATLLIHSYAIYHPEAKLHFVEYCHYFKYPVETHTIQTEDGYLLTFYRIQAKSQNIQSGKKVLLLQHGLLDSSDTYIINDEDKSPAFILANQGFDIWLGNNRGNVHSRNHIKYTVKDAEFWDFTLEEFAVYDLPAAFEYIYQQTNQKITYIGHSQGTTQMHIHLSMFKESSVRKLMEKYVGLAPSAFVTKKSSILLKLLGSGLIDFLEKKGMKQFLPGETFISTQMGRLYCGTLPKVCGDFIGSLISSDPKLDNYDRYDVLSAHAPGGTSLKNLKHRQQFQLSGRFARFDYGGEENLIRYGSELSPEYDLSNIDIPVYLFAGNEDKLATPEDVHAFINALVNCPLISIKFYEAGHCTYMWGKNLTYMEDLLAILQ